MFVKLAQLCVLAFTVSMNVAHGETPKPSKYNKNQPTPFKIWRPVFTEDESVEENTPAFLREMYGANLFLIDSDKHPSKHHKPKLVDGIVLHYYPQKPDHETRWFQSKQGLNPVADAYQFLDDIIEQKFPHLSNLEDKWDEYQFLKEAAPKVAPPETHLVSEFIDSELSDAEMDLVKDAVDIAMKRHKMKNKDDRKKLIKAEVMRRTLDKQMGRSIVKGRIAMHSEGKLPMTHKDWIETYAQFLANPKNSTPEGEEIHNMLKHPEKYIAQSMVGLKREIRVHVVQGKVLENASFLRFYHLNEYLPEDEQKKLKAAVEEHLIGALRKKYGEKWDKISATPDVALTEEGKITILDLNIGMDSGYYKPWEDMFTSNELIRHYTGQSTPFLDYWKGVDAAKPGPEKVKAIKAFFKKWGEYIDVMDPDMEIIENYFDRIITSYAKHMRAEPSSERFEQALNDFWDVGLRTPAIYLQFINQMQDTIKKADGSPLRLNKNAQSFWSKRIGKLDGSYSENAPFESVQVDESGRIKGISPGKSTKTTNCGVALGNVFAKGDLSLARNASIR